MKLIIFSAISVFIVGAICACSDFFSISPRELPPPSFEQTMAVSAFLLDVDTAFQARVSYTVNPYQSVEPDDDLDDRYRVRLRSESGAWRYLDYLPPHDRRRAFTTDTSKNYRLSPQDVPITPGAILEFEVEHPEYGAASSRQTVPHPAAPLTISYLGQIGIHEISRQPINAVRIEIETRPGNPKYYMVSIEGPGERLNRLAGKWEPASVSYNINSPTPGVFSLRKSLEASPCVFLSDEHIDGPYFSFMLHTLAPMTPEIRLVWRVISPQWYHFAISVINQWAEMESIFTGGGVLQALSNVESNVEGGVGCFGVGLEQRHAIIE
jgi:hypothetical protein